MGNTGVTQAMKSVNSMLGISSTNSADREDGDRLPEGEKYFGFTNVPF